MPDFPQDIAPKACLPFGDMMSKVLLEEFLEGCCSPTFQSNTRSASRNIHIVVGEWCNHGHFENVSLFKSKVFRKVFQQV